VGWGLQTKHITIPLQKTLIKNYDLFLLLITSVTKTWGGGGGIMSPCQIFCHKFWAIGTFGRWLYHF